MTLSKNSMSRTGARRDLRVGGENAEIFALDAYHYCCSDHTAAHRARLCDPLVSQHLHWEWALANRSVRGSTRTSSPNKLLCWSRPQWCRRASAGIWRGAPSGRPQRQNPRHPGAVTEEIAVLFGSLCWRPAPSYPPAGSVLDPGSVTLPCQRQHPPHVESTLAQRVLIFSTKIVPG